MPSTIRSRITKIEKKVENSIDQVLLGLQHRGLNLKEFNFKESQDAAQNIAQKVGRKVLERADEIRAQLAEQPYSPSWLKDVSLAPRPEIVDATAEENIVSEITPEAASSMSDATVSKAAAGMLADDSKKVASRAKKAKASAKAKKATPSAKAKNKTSKNSKKSH
ncbi:MAG: hypothetical protein V4692_03140 [Bdellovibrionota bacterium]